MTGPQTPGTPPQRPRAVLARLDVGNLREDLWCADCKALSGFAVDVLAMHDGGVTVVGTVTGCSICMDADPPGVGRG